jgi:hypothetical protein
VVSRSSDIHKSLSVMQGEVSLQAKKKKSEKKKRAIYIAILPSEPYNYGIYIALILYTAQ